MIDCRTKVTGQRATSPGTWLHCRGEVGLTITQRILEQQPDLQLFSLRAVAAHRRLTIALDKVCT
jgi:hypothetical protein